MTSYIQDDHVDSLYILNSQNEPVKTTREFFKDFIINHADRRIIGRDMIKVNGTNIIISTLFTGVVMKGCLFQTIILGGEYSSSSFLYQTYQQAVDGHDSVVMAFKESYESEIKSCA